MSRIRLNARRASMSFLTEAEMISRRSMLTTDHMIYCQNTNKTYLYNGGTSNTIADFTLVNDDSENIKNWDTTQSYHVNDLINYNNTVYRVLTEQTPPYTQTPDQNSIDWEPWSLYFETGTFTDYFVNSVIKTPRNPGSNVSLTYNKATYAANSNAAWSQNSVALTGVIKGSHINSVDQNYYYFNGSTSPSLTISGTKSSNVLPSWNAGANSEYTATVTVLGLANQYTTTGTTANITIPNTATSFDYILVGGGGGGSGGTGSAGGQGGGGGEGGQVLFGNVDVSTVKNKTLAIVVGAGGSGMAGRGDARPSWTGNQGGQSAIYELSGVYLFARGGQKGTAGGSAYNTPGVGGGTGAASNNGMDGATGRGWSAGTTIVSSGTAPVFSIIADGITSVGYARGGDGGGSTGTNNNGAAGAAGATPGSGGGGGQGSGWDNTGGAGGAGASGAFYLSYTNGGSVTRVNWTTPGSYTHAIPSTATNIQYLLIAGGGGGGGGAGRGGGGGGGGGEGGEWLNSTNAAIAGQTLHITVGAGGDGDAAGGGGAGTGTGSSGYDSYVIGKPTGTTFTPITAIGGRGGSSSGQESTQTTRRSWGGTGGPGADGGIGGTWTTNTQGDAGVAGTTVPTVGTYTGRTLGGGGGGGSAATSNGGAGGTGGGGAGGNGVSSGTAGAGGVGTANTGGGGGGGGGSSGGGAGSAGGSGIAVIRYNELVTIPILRSSYWTSAAGVNFFEANSNAINFTSSNINQQLALYRETMDLIAGSLNIV